MPELPDITVYIEALEQRIRAQKLEQVRFANPFLLRTVDPPVAAAVGHTVARLRRVGKRIAIGMDNDVWLVLHLMIAGRLHWKKPLKDVSGLRNVGYNPSSYSLLKHLRWPYHSLSLLWHLPNLCEHNHGYDSKSAAGRDPR